MKEVIQKYFKAWLNVDIDVLSDVFSTDIIYSECYGPEYHGKSQILKGLMIGIKKVRFLSGQ